MAQDAKLSAANIANIGKGSDKVMGQNSCQPVGLRLKSALTLSADLDIFAIWPASSFALSPIFARNAHAFHYVRRSKGLLTSGSERLADARNEVRNVAEYEGHFDADATMLRNLIEAAEAVRAAVMALPALPES